MTSASSVQFLACRRRVTIGGYGDMTFTPTILWACPQKSDAEVVGVFGELEHLLATQFCFNSGHDRVPRRDSRCSIAVIDVVMI